MTSSPPPVSDEITCLCCRFTAALRNEWREELIAQSIASFALAGRTVCASA